MNPNPAISTITSGYRPIYDGKQYDRFFGKPDFKDKKIIRDGIVEQTVNLMKKVVWRYIDDTKKIALVLKGNNIESTCHNIWTFLYNHIQYKLDKKGLEQLRRPNRSWAERYVGIDCDCFSIFVSSILTNLKIPHLFRITKYDEDIYQHVYVIVPYETGSGEYIIDCVISQFNYEKPYSEKKDFTMNLNGIDVAVLSGTTPTVIDLVNDLEGIDNLGSESEEERLKTIYAHLVNTRNMVASKPHLVENIDYPPAFLKMLDYAIQNWNTPNRDKALAILAQNEDALNKHFQMDGIEEYSDLEGLDESWQEIDSMNHEEIDELLGKLFGKKKGKKQEKKNKKESKTTKKGFFKKVGEAIKKGGKAFVRYNPVTVSARNGFLLALKLNIKKMGSKLKWGYATQEQAAAKGINTDLWNRSKNALQKVEKLFADKLQGKREKLKDAILKGKAGGLNGIDEDESYEITGLGAAPAAAALVAAVPVITSCLKIMVDSGIMSSKEADDLQAEVNEKAAEGEKVLEKEPDLKDEEDTNTSTKSLSEENPSDESGDDKNNDTSEGGFIGFVKKNPLLVISGTGLAIWGLSKFFGRNKKANSTQKELSGVKTAKKKNKQAKTKSQLKARKAKIKNLGLS